MTTLTHRSRRSEPAVERRSQEEDAGPGGYPPDDDERDSKDLRLTLMEEILLLGLKDREVWCYLPCPEREVSLVPDSQHRTHSVQRPQLYIKHVLLDRGSERKS